MTQINVDIEKVKNAGKDIISLSSALTNMVDNFYSRISDIPEKTKEWVGVESEKYVQLCLREQEVYINLFNSLSLLGESLVSYSEDLEAMVNSMDDVLCQK